MTGPFNGTRAKKGKIWTIQRNYCKKEKITSHVTGRFNGTFLILFFTIGENGSG